MNEFEWQTTGSDSRLQKHASMLQSSANFAWISPSVNKTIRVCVQTWSFVQMKADETKADRRCESESPKSASQTLACQQLVQCLVQIGPAWTGHQQQVSWIAHKKLRPRPFGFFERAHSIQKEIEFVFVYVAILRQRTRKVSNWQTWQKKCNRVAPFESTWRSTWCKVFLTCIIKDQFIKQDFLEPQISW